MQHLRQHRLIVQLPLIPFMNELLISLNNPKAGFPSTAIFAYLCFYILMYVRKGKIKFGIRVPFCCRFIPVKEN